MEASTQGRFFPPVMKHASGEPSLRVDRPVPLPFGHIMLGYPNPRGGYNYAGFFDPSFGRREMRIWTLHPKYLDAKGLVALWREALLARQVLRGMTRGYRNHPQLERFQTQPDPLAGIESYLAKVFEESQNRGYHFDRSKLSAVVQSPTMDETDGQLRFEWQHLLAKLEQRDPDRHLRLRSIEIPDPHPLFRIIPGPVQTWERSSSQ